MTKLLADFEIGKEYTSADKCEECGKHYSVIIVGVTKHTKLGYVHYACDCGDDDDIGGWEYYKKKTIVVDGIEFYPLKWKANIDLTKVSLEEGIEKMLELRENEKKNTKKIRK